MFGIGGGLKKSARQAKATVGEVLDVRYDPKSLKAVFDLKGDSRWDVLVL